MSKETNNNIDGLKELFTQRFDSSDKFLEDKFRENDECHKRLELHAKLTNGNVVKNNDFRIKMKDKVKEIDDNSDFRTTTKAQIKLWKWFIGLLGIEGVVGLFLIIKNLI